MCVALPVDVDIANIWSNLSTAVLYVFVASCLALTGCMDGRTDAPQPLLEKMASNETRVDFVNEVREGDGLSVIVFESFYNGAGVGIGDVNGDGRPDLFFASNMDRSRLYLNEGGMVFTDATEQAGIDTRGRWANGVALSDVNDDGLLDIYVSCGGPYAEPSRRANLLYVSQGDGTFEERAAEYGLADTGVTTQAAFFDYDRDGDLDVYLLTNGIGETGPNVIVPKKSDGESVNTDRLYRNDDGRFTNVSREANILLEGYGLGVAVIDVDGDGWDDIYAANDYLSNDVLYVNNGDGTFTDRAAEYFRHQSYASMGTDAADINNDGLVDLITVDMLPAENRRVKVMYGEAGYDRQRSELEAGYDRQLRRNTLQLNNGARPGETPSFSDVSHLAGVSSTGWSWSSLFADIDNDGRRDLTITNGLPRDVTNLDFSAYKARALRSGRYDREMLDELADALAEVEPVSIRNYVFRNEGDLTFSDQSFAWGFREPSFSTGAAFADLDDDGDLDLVVNNVNAAAGVYRNRASERLEHRYLSVALHGPPGNVLGLGAHVAVHAGGRRQVHHHTIYRGYLSTMGADVHFGLGDATQVDSIVVAWPDGRRQVLADIAPNQTVPLRYEDAVEGRRPAESEAETVFSKAGDRLDEPFRHQEQHYNDFKLQPLLPHKYSQNGPGLAVGDVNGDGRDDFYVGGAFGQAGRLYLQTSTGSFETAARVDFQTAASAEKHYEEDMGSIFFDADGDGHLDLYVVSGGSEFPHGSDYYQDRLYHGDGTGGFEQRPDALPPMTASGSVVAAADFDRDGDLDLFVGGRVVPNSYPAAPRSYLLENDGGRFTDVTDRLAPDLANPGLVTAALWSDFNDDGRTDLIVVGEWMPISFFENRGNGLVNVTRDVGMANTVGWWNSIAAGDFDRDGDTDYVAGNLGLNTSLRNRPEGPVRAYVNDFNRDGRIETLLSRFTDGGYYPAHLRDDLLSHFPRLAQHFPTYESYGAATIGDVLDALGPTDHYLLESDTFASSYVENERGTFRAASLPIEAQVAPVFGILSDDFDGDGNLDALLVGNSHATEAFIGPYDAFNGLLLLGDGGDSFAAASLRESGFLVAGDAKGLASIAWSGGEQLIVASQNDDEIRTHRTRRTAAVVAAQPDETHAEMFYTDGRTEKVEFYRGSGYLSQSSRVVRVEPAAAKVRFFRGDEVARTWHAATTAQLRIQRE